MQKAQELVRASAPATADLAPYKQIITRDNGDKDAEVTIADVVAPVYEQTRRIINNNRDYTIKYQA